MVKLACPEPRELAYSHAGNQADMRECQWDGEGCPDCVVHHCDECAYQIGVLMAQILTPENVELKPWFGAINPRALTTCSRTTAWLWSIEP